MTSAGREAGEQIDRDFSEVEAWADDLRTALEAWMADLKTTLETWAAEIEARITELEEST